MDRAHSPTLCSALAVPLPIGTAISKGQSAGGSQYASTKRRSKKSSKEYGRDGRVGLIFV